MTRPHNIPKSPLEPPRFKRIALVTWGFFRMGMRATISYPMGVVLFQASILVTVVTIAFLSKLIQPSASIGPSYLGFAATGFAGSQVVLGPLLGLGQELDATIQQGRMEMLLIEPISWKLIPIALGAWPAIYRLSNVISIFLLVTLLGVSFQGSHLPLVILLVILGSIAGIGLGSCAGSLRVLSKKSDPISTVYVIVSGLISGQTFPITLLPTPLRDLAWLFPSTYVISGLRSGLIPQSTSVYGPDLNESTFALSVICVLLVPTGMILFRRSLEVGRSYGLLAGY